MTVDDVGSRLSRRYETVLAEQVQQVLARRIRSRVDDARADPDRSSRRWPFELIQNAHDAKQRDGRDGIALSFQWMQGQLVYTHDAAPFNMGDLAALLTGGSSKDFDSKETTGRFGTGFLVTHVLSHRAHVVGVLQEDEELRTFDVHLHRPPDEDEILRSITASKVALAKTEVVPDFNAVPTTTVSYEVDDPRVADVGLDVLEECLPYLFGSCRRLSEIRIQRDSGISTWRVVRRDELVATDTLVHEDTIVERLTTDGDPESWRVVRAATKADARGWVLAVVRGSDSEWVLWEPPEEVPRLFRQLPVLGSPSPATWVVIDGQFDLDQERSSIHVIGDRAAPLREALEALGPLAMLAKHEGWTDAHRVGQLAMPQRDLGSEAKEVWKTILASAANELSLLPLVDTVRNGALSAVKSSEEGLWVDFIDPDIAGNDHVELWSLAVRCITRDPPIESASVGWSEVARGWSELGVKINWLSLPDVGRWARESASRLDELQVSGDRYEWLAAYYDAVARRWRAGGVQSEDLHGLIPDQHHRLRDPGSLRCDAGISERLKQIAERVGYDIRSAVVDDELTSRLEGTLYGDARFALAKSTGEDIAESEVITLLAKRLSDALPFDRQIAEKSRTAFEATLQLLGHLWLTLEVSAKQIVATLPFVSQDGGVSRIGPQRMFVAPIACWPDTAQPFAAAFPASRILSKEYAETEGSAPMEALVRWGAVHDGLVIASRRKELRDRGLTAIAVQKAAATDAKLSDAELSQIALLEPEVLNHCKQSRDSARALLGFVVCHAARVDPSWRAARAFEVMTPSGKKSIELTPTLWLADLKSKPWIPVEAAGSVTEHPPNPAILRDLIDSRWLEQNADGADLLVKHFDMDALDVQLLAVGTDDASRKNIRDQLARIVESTGADEGLIAALAQRAAEQRRDMDRLRALGLAVQARVQDALDRHGLMVKFIDRGYDFLVSEPVVGDEDDASICVQVGAFKIEVKTTTIDEVRLTPLQAATAATDAARFVLCVVDLRTVKAEALTIDWSQRDVREFCTFIQGTTLPVVPTLALIQDAEVGDVPVRNTAALRYAVSAERWLGGVGLDRWVEETFGREIDPSALAGEESPTDGAP